MLLDQKPVSLHYLAFLYGEKKIAHLVRAIYANNSSFDFKHRIGIFYNKIGIFGYKTNLFTSMQTSGCYTCLKLC